jgi:hypothetical protein
LLGERLVERTFARVHGALRVEAHPEQPERPPFRDQRHAPEGLGSPGGSRQRGELRVRLAVGGLTLDPDGLAGAHRRERRRIAAGLRNASDALDDLAGDTAVTEEL